MNALGIDPNSLNKDFRQDWLNFQGSRVKLFLVLWLQKELDETHRLLETVVPNDLGKVQGRVLQITKIRNLVEQKFCEDSLKELLAYLDKKER